MTAVRSDTQFPHGDPRATAHSRRRRRLRKKGTQQGLLSAFFAGFGAASTNEQIAWVYTQALLAAVIIGHL